MGVFEEVMAGLNLVPRAQQTKLVELARETVTKGGQRFVQAGTGTGKSYVLLSVALEAARESGLPSVVVCPNNTLIDQYVGKDVVSLGEVAPGKWAHIKGRNRYICANSLATFTMDRDAANKYYLKMIDRDELEWAKLFVGEDWACPGSDLCNPTRLHGFECNKKTIFKEKKKFDLEDSTATEMIQISVCECPFNCGAVEAKRKAADAEVVITNAHVLVWDYLVGLFTDGQAGLLPEYGALFVDECHELEAIGRGCLSDEISETSPMVSSIEGLARWVEERRVSLVDAGASEAPLERSLAVMAMAEDAKRLIWDLEFVEDPTKTQQLQLRRLKKFVEFVGESEDFVSIIDVQDPDKAKLRRVCVDAGSTFNRILTGQPTVLVSGTIPGSDRRRLGLPKEARTQYVGHPFDYSKSTLIISRFNPTKSADRLGRVASAARAINETGGGTLVLFTSWKDAEIFMPMIAERLTPGIDVYLQSREDPATLADDIADFSKDGNAVLAGVRSLFTGLDIPGPALRQVILWKLPWPYPTIETQAIQDRFGRNTYKDMMLTILVQGIGRLIRKTDDTGRVLILDSRAKKLDFNSNGMTHHLAEFGKA